MATRSKEDKAAKRTAKLVNLRNVLGSKADADGAYVRGGSGELYRRVIEDDMMDPYGDIYGDKKLKVPPYSFARLYKIYEESDILQSCVEAMQKNVDGFGYQMVFLGDDLKEKENPQNQLQLVTAQNFFDHINEDQSFTTLRQLVREDVEVLGNGAIEVIRNLNNDIQLMYYLPFKGIRVGTLEGDPVPIKVTLPRAGKMQELEVKRYFRKFAQLRSDGVTLRWFKEFGDPRTMDALTGQYTDSPQMSASEIFHLKLPFGGLTYGLPRWIGAILSIMGRRQAEYVNYDLFENQGIPPMAIMVSGGTLTDESLDELEVLVKGMRGAENWNKIVILEALVEGVGLEDRGSAKLELKNLAEYRKEDTMFSNYLSMAEKAARHRFRLPPLYVGASENFTHATAKAAQTVAEEQVFIPERALFDEIVCRKILPSLKVTKWQFRSKGPRIVGAEMLTTALQVFTGAGAFTVNHAIERANEAFGLEMSKFKSPWADYPVPFVMEMIKAGQITAKDMIEGMKFTEPPPQLEGPKQPLMLPAPAPTNGKNKAIEKAMASDLFSDDEKALYKMLLTMQSAVEEIHRTSAEN